jgi:hypothetical protein
MIPIRSFVGSVPAARMGSGKPAAAVEAAIDLRKWRRLFMIAKYLL